MSHTLAYERSLTVWAARRKLNPSQRHTLCGHSLLGRTSPDYDHVASCCSSLLGSGSGTTWDHVRCFSRRGRTIALTGHAYASRSTVEEALRPYAQRLGLTYWVGSAQESVYYPGCTIPWILAAPKDGDGRPLHAAFLAPDRADLDDSRVTAGFMAFALVDRVNAGLRTSHS